MVAVLLVRRTVSQPATSGRGASWVCISRVALGTTGKVTDALSADWVNTKGLNYFSKILLISKVTGNLTLFSLVS